VAAAILRERAGIVPMAVEEQLGSLLEFRLKCRRNPLARALVDRGLALVAEAQQAPLSRRIAIEVEILRLLEMIEDRALIATPSRR